MEHSWDEKGLYKRRIAPNGIHYGHCRNCGNLCMRRENPLTGEMEITTNVITQEWFLEKYGTLDRAGCREEEGV